MRLSRSTRKGIGLAAAVLSVAVLVGLLFLPKASVIRSDLRAEIKLCPWPPTSSATFQPRRRAEGEGLRTSRGRGRAGALGGSEREA